MSDLEHPSKVRRFVRSPVLTLVVGIIALAFAMGAYQVLRSNAETEQVRRELAAARVELAAREVRDDCIIGLQAGYFKADSAWSIAFAQVVVGVALGGDIPTLIAGLDTATANKQMAYIAFDQQISCPK